MGPSQLKICRERCEHTIHKNCKWRIIFVLFLCFVRLYFVVFNYSACKKYVWSWFGPKPTIMPLFHRQKWKMTIFSFTAASKKTWSPEYTGLKSIQWKVALFRDWSYHNHVFGQDWAHCFFSCHWPKTGFLAFFCITEMTVRILEWR